MGRQSKYQVIVSEQAKRMLVSQAAFLAQASLAAAEKRYLLIFQIREDIVYVDYVVDCRQDYAWLLH